jgi:hypothetical protein
LASSALCVVRILNLLCTAFFSVSKLCNFSDTACKDFLASSEVATNSANSPRVALKALSALPIFLVKDSLGSKSI